VTAGLAGRRVDAADAAQARFPRRLVAAVEERVEAALRDAGCSALVCAAACGADLVALGVAQRCGIDTWVVLPYAVAEFRRSSVVDRGEEWGALFDTAVEQAEELGRLSILGLSVDDDNAYPATNAAILDKAVSLSNGDSASTLAIAVWDGPLSGRTDYTADFVEAARVRGIRVESVPILEDHEPAR
jgi:hypothetical protein